MHKFRRDCFAKWHRFTHRSDMFTADVTGLDNRVLCKSEVILVIMGLKFTSFCMKHYKKMDGFMQKSLLLVNLIFHCLVSLLIGSQCSQSERFCCADLPRPH